MAGYERSVRKNLKKSGWQKVRQGSRHGHEIWSSPNGRGQEVSVPVKIKSRHTANEIMKAAGIAKSF